MGDEQGSVPRKVDGKSRREFLKLAALAGAGVAAGAVAKTGVEILTYTKPEEDTRYAIEGTPVRASFETIDRVTANYKGTSVNAGLIKAKLYHDLSRSMASNHILHNYVTMNYDNNGEAYYFVWDNEEIARLGGGFIERQPTAVSFPDELVIPSFNTLADGIAKTLQDKSPLDVIAFHRVRAYINSASVGQLAPPQWLTSEDGIDIVRSAYGSAYMIQDVNAVLLDAVALPAEFKKYFT